MTKGLAHPARAGAVRTAAFVIALIATVPAWADDPVVSITNFAFSPQRVTVKLETTVVWTNADDFPHTVTSSTNLFKSKVLGAGDKFSFAFTRPGTYTYFCSLHPHMTGTIVVEAAVGSDTLQ
jgi:plastocyanin